MPLVSIIVPVYKAEKWLHRCVDSILAQTMTDFELLLIDDGSPDKSGEICDEYATKDSRVRVFHKENGGVSSARNIGLDNATGEWISFVDADDWVEKEYLEKLTERGDTDMVLCGCKYTTGEICSINKEIIFKERIGEFIKEYSEDHFVRTVWGKLIRKRIIKKKQLRFDENVRFGEDTFFNREALVCSDFIYVIDFVGYNYYMPNEDFVLSKYAMSFEEVEYVTDIMVRQNALMLSLYGIRLEKKEWQDFFIQALKFEDIIRVGNKKYYDLCRSYYLNLTKEKFYSNSILSPICKGIVQLKEYYFVGNKDEVKFLFNRLCEFFIEMPILVKFKIKDFYLWYFLIKCGCWNIFDFFMSIYCKFIK